MTERTLREKIAEIFAEDDAFVGIGRDSYDKADRVLALLDAHTAEQPSPDAVAERPLPQIRFGVHSRPINPIDDR